ncbi:MAG: NAD-dependent epimerase/dehydratase family protein [Chitinophagales bacterium]|nr:NAD-dependent epimerase/dehydratase family protein [Chitinophagales bacterium]
MPKILITGGAGFIASCLASKLSEDQGNYVVIVDNMVTGSLEKLPSQKFANWHFIKSDVNKFADISSVMVSYQFDYVFHYAAMVGVQRTLNNPVMVLNDIKGIRNILDLSKNTGVKCVYYSSSSEVYGESVHYPQDEETTPLNSRLPYAVVKNVGESFLKSYYQEYGLNYTIFRFFNTYGPNQSQDFVISKFLRAAIQNRDVTIFGDGMQTRTFCFIEDNITATVNEFKASLFKNNVVNIGSDAEISVLDLARLIIKITGSQSKIVFLPPLKEGDMNRRRPDISRMKKLLPHDLISLEEGLRRTIESGRF